MDDERKNSELQAARDFQQSMLPKFLPARNDLDIATFLRSSTEIGGDYYDFFEQMTPDYFLLIIEVLQKNKNITNFKITDRSNGYWNGEF